MTRFVIRVWLPDKPGALGRVASAIGSVGASLIGIDILEEDGGYAIDEFVVDAVDSVNATEKLIAALTFVEGVNIEDIRLQPTDVIDPRLDALQTAGDLVDQETVDGLRKTLVIRSQQDLKADWAALVSLLPDDNDFVVEGNAPAQGWVRAFVEGSRTSEAFTHGKSGPDDTAWAELSDAKQVLVLGREGRPFRARERDQLFALVRIADRLLTSRLN